MVAFRVTFLPNSVVLSQFWRDGRPRATCLFRSIQVSLKSDTFVVSPYDKFSYSPSYLEPEAQLEPYFYLIVIGWSSSWIDSGSCFLLPL
jgi:hypothetical protein